MPFAPSVQERPVHGGIEEVVWQKPSGTLLRLREASGSSLLLVPSLLRLRPAGGLWLSGFASGEEGFSRLVRGAVYAPPPPQVRPPRPDPNPLLEEIGASGEDFSSLLACAQAYLKGQAPPAPQKGCEALARLLGMPYGPLVAWGFPQKLARLLWEAFGPGALDYLAVEPYAPLDLGVPFGELDRLYLKGGLDPDHPQRHVAYARHFLERHFARTGNTVASLPELEEALGASLPLFLVGFSYAEEREEMVAQRNEISLRRWWDIEGDLARLLLLPKEPPPLKGGRVRANLPEEAQTLLRFLGEGRSALLLGGAGTGKTTVLKHVVEAVEGALLLAPTGKAANRLAQATGREAFTVHAALFREDLLLRARLVVVDEAGMLGSETLWLLVTHLGERIPLLLVGDPMQLPPVEPGHPFRDLADHLPALWLTKVHRSEESLTRLAEAIRTGSLDEASPLWGEGVELRPLEEKALQQLFKAYNPERTAVLTPLRRGRWGTEGLNALAAKALKRPPGLSPGMPVVYLRNNPVLGYANGEVDWLEALGADGSLQTRSGRLLPPWAAKDVEGAYALTVHRSQGSEWEEVYVLLPKEGIGLMDRSWLYTAVTRARRGLVFLEEEEGLLWRAYRKTAPRRETLLRRFLEGGGKRKGRRR